jgi:hypothetical protein
VVRVERALCALILVGLVGGCTSDGDKPAIQDPSAAATGAAAAGGSAPAWTEPASYSFALSRGCEEAAPVGRYQATVANGKIVTSERIGALSAVPSSSAEVDLGPATEGQQGEEIEVPTLAELVAMAKTAEEDGAEVSTEFHAGDGHPVKVKINVGDDPLQAECWNVSEYRAGS